MFAFIKGELVQAFDDHVVIETGGIGYCIYIPANLFAKLPQLGSAILLHTSYVVREMSHTLYGFLSSQECSLFETLMGVTGIGPKLALSLIGHMQLTDLQQAIANHDIPAICRVPGVGKKTAERLIVELRDKLPKTQSIEPSGMSIQVPSDLQTQKIRDAMSALINLGYHQTAAQKALKKTLENSDEDVDLGTLITASLKYI